MTILVITPTTSATSGWGRMSRAIAQELAAQGHAPIVAAEEGNRQITLRPFSPFAFIANVFRLRRAARTADIVHAFDGGRYALYAFFATLGRRTPYFILGVGTYSIAPLYARMWRHAVRFVYRKAAHIFCISRYVLTELRAAGVASDNASVVHLGATPLPRVTRSEAEAARSRFGIPALRRPVILTVGAIKDRKGQLDTLHAVALLKKTYPEALYAVVGAPNRPEYLRRLRDSASALGIESSLRALSAENDHDLACLYTLADVLALNSHTDARTHHFEGFGLVILEAAQFGKPAVGSRGSGIEDAIEDGASGLLAAQGDPEDIAEKITTILHDYDSFSRGARTHHARFTWTATVNAYLDEYHKAAP